MTARPVEIVPGVVLGGDSLPIIAGPCAAESEELALEIGEWLAATAERLGFPAVFKASFDKANRSSISSYRGPGLERGLEILAAVGRATSLPLTTDVHSPEQCGPAAEVCDLLQIPAFLCRQTDLVVAAARTGRPLNLKKGQFMAPDAMRRIVDKARSVGNDRISVTERGTCFGYHDLVVDLRAIAAMQEDGIAVIYDVTHSLQQPGSGEQTGGKRRFAEPLARAAVAAGADAVFVEVHPNPAAALSDAATQLPPARATALLESLQAVHRAVHPAADVPATSRAAGP